MVHNTTNINKTYNHWTQNREHDIWLWKSKSWFCLGENGVVQPVYGISTLSSDIDNADINKQLKSEQSVDFCKQLYKVTRFIRSFRVTVQDFIFNKRQNCYIEILLQAMKYKYTT